MIRSIHGLAIIVLMWCACAPLHAASAEPLAPLKITSSTMTVTLDPMFPRVYEYRTADGRTLPGAFTTSRPTIMLNGQTYSPGDFSVEAQTTDSSVEYVMKVSALDLELDWRFEVKGSELTFVLTRVVEKGDFQLRILDIPNHDLVRIPAASGKGTAYRGEYKRQGWNEFLPNLYHQAKGRFMTISKEDSDPYAKNTNWASGEADGIGATIANNIPYWKLKTQILGGEGPGTDYVIYLGTYYYRISGEVQPLMKSTVGVLSDDRNNDGVLNWMEAALWHRDRLRTPSNTFEPSTLCYMLYLDWIKPIVEPSGGYAPPLATFEQAIEIVRGVAKVTGDAHQRATLVGWQFTGHDMGFPALNVVNEKIGGRAGLLKFIDEARKYNVNIEYHVDIDDAYPGRPLFDESVLLLDHDGKPYPWAKYYDGVPPVYRISDLKQWRTGYFQKRMAQLMETVPVKGAIRLDTFRNCDISIGPGEEDGIVAETVYGAKILNWFMERDIQPSTEGPMDAYYGLAEGILHRFAIEDPFHMLMMQGKVYGGGKCAGPGQALGWSLNLGWGMRDEDAYGGAHIDGYTENSVADWYFLGNLTQSYLLKKDLIWLGSESGGEMETEKDGKKSTVQLTNYVAKFKDGTVSTFTDDKHWTVLDHGVKTVDGDLRMLPMSENEIVLYSVAGGEIKWQLPANWAGARVSVFTISEPSVEPSKYSIGPDGTATIKVLGRKGYRVKRL